MTEQGYRVLVVEQTETPEQLELRRKEKGSKDKVGCFIYTDSRIAEFLFAMYQVFVSLFLELANA